MAKLALVAVIVVCLAYVFARQDPGRRTTELASGGRWLRLGFAGLVVAAALWLLLR
jgi:hypothetical protein